jgi:molybdate transport system substrate-binding protein
VAERVLHLLCAGAAKGVVEALAPAFRAEAGLAVEATFGAVGAIREHLDGGAPCDVVVLTAAMIEALAAAGRVVPRAVAALGVVRTGIAVRDGDAAPSITDAAALRAALAGARAVYLPDPDRSTAGIHFAGIVRRLGIEDAVRARWRAFPNGAVAMRALADATEDGLLGCTQVTEISYTRGVTLAGVLPREFELATVYSAAVIVGARETAAGGRLVEWLGGPRSLALRAAGGFEP